MKRINLKYVFGLSAGSIIAAALMGCIGTSVTSAGSSDAQATAKTKGGSLDSTGTDSVNCGHQDTTANQKVDGKDSSDTDAGGKAPLAKTNASHEGCDDGDKCEVKDTEKKKTDVNDKEWPETEDKDTLAVK